MRAILTYHSLDDSGSPISVAPDEFRGHLRWLASGRVPVVSLERLVAMPAGAEGVALTFDDGFANFGEIAAPLLRDHGLPATVFVVSGHVGHDNAWGGHAADRVPRLPLLDWEELGRLAEEGVTLGAHTRTHPHLTQVTVAQREDELSGAAETIRERTGRVPRQFAYPYGDVDDAVAEETRAVFSLAVTTELRVLDGDDDLLRLPRLDMYYLRSPGRLESWGTARFHRTLWFRAQARRARATLAVVLGGW